MLPPPPPVRRQSHQPYLVAHQGYPRDRDRDADTDREREREREKSPDVVITKTIEQTRDTQNNPVINHYLISHKLGNGQHGEVFKGYDMVKNNMAVVRSFPSALASCL